MGWDLPRKGVASSLTSLKESGSLLATENEKPAMITYVISYEQWLV